MNGRTLLLSVPDGMPDIAVPVYPDQGGAMKIWQLHEAKVRLNEVIKKATKEGPQSITVHGVSCAVAISQVEYERLKYSRKSFVECMRQSPLCGLEPDLKRLSCQVSKLELS